MVSYDRLWETMKRKSISTYTLETKYNFSNATINRLKHNKPVTTTTLESLCLILDCEIQEIIEIKK